MRRFYAWHVGFPLLLGLLLIAVFEATTLDRMLSDLFYDPAAREFPLRRDGFLEQIVHRGGRYLVVLVAVGALGIWASSFVRAGTRPLRRPALYVLLCLALGPGIVAGLKTLTNKHCPYDLATYGGFAEYTRLFESAPPGQKPGRCFPGGHASGGFALMAFYFVWRRRRPGWAAAALVSGFAYGFSLGFGRIMQGAHFLSHNLWAALVCWFVALVLWRLMLYEEDRPS
jgi:membrane-associated PAP2 superfamily phosphatase